MDITPLFPGCSHLTSSCCDASGFGRRFPLRALVFTLVQKIGPLPSLEPSVEKKVLYVPSHRPKP